MSLRPPYGATALDFDELEALTPAVRYAPVSLRTKAAIYDIEQSFEERIGDSLTDRAVVGSIGLDLILTRHFISLLHHEMYGQLWTWAGTYRRRTTNIGVDPAYIQTELQHSLDTIRYRWRHTTDWTAAQLGIAVHAEVARIHPFFDGNGRSSRVLADIVFGAAQNGRYVERYEWQVNREQYIQLLRAYDRHRNSADLAAFISVEEWEE
ncbi:cell filamentation protein Fic [Mycetocola tolaasinivorans]|uniref:Cell filamentation protein Fic n=1 Tax=Mycetocola tolaasinivorans TaxID=76635 RepID=A0A3L7ABL1_9MICO|nr:Fic family protein [Mycetocola tolaasinivorans]RLP77385.1 cell filamentation protein Fic [Mycetocola tolaasinivorans]